VTFSVRVRCSAAKNISFAVLQWDGGEDSVTSDVAASWSGSGLPTLATNVTQAGSTGQTALSVSTWADVSTTVTLGSSFTNLIIFVWTDTTLSQNTTLDLEAAQLERGSAATPFEVRPVGAELALCQRYLERIGGRSFDAFGIVQSTTTDDANGVVIYSKKRIVPTVSIDDVTHFLVAPPNGGAGIVLTALSFSPINVTSLWARIDVASGLAVGNASLFYSNGNVGQGYIDLDAEL
jgi:hypothetical protein